MNVELSEARKAYLYIDREENIAIFPMAKNPKYTGEITDPFRSEPMMLLSKTPIELKYPYSMETLADSLRNAIEQWGQNEPYTQKRMSIEEFYYKTKGFKEATLGTKLFLYGWDDVFGKRVTLSLPAKSGKYHYTMATRQLSEEANWLDYANVIIELARTDVTTIGAYKAFKSKLNI